MAAASSQTKSDFFISYAREDLPWAEWIGWELEANGFTVLLEAWDFRPGDNFLREIESAIEKAERTIAVLSPAYLASAHAKDELLASLLYGSEERQRLLPIRVSSCDLTRFLAAHIYIDLVDLEVAEAQKALREGVRRSRAKPQSPPRFPGLSVAPFPVEGWPSSDGKPAMSEDSHRSKTLAIFPFDSRGLCDSFLLQGFCDELVGQFTRLQNLHVISPPSVEPLLATSAEPSVLGQRLGADLLLLGHLRGHDVSHKLQVQLVRSADSVTTWTKSYPFRVDSLLRLKSRVSRDLVAALGNGESVAHSRLEGSPTRVERAYELYLRGYGLLASNSESNIRDAVRLLDTALGLDSGFARARAARGYAEWRMYFSGWDAGAATLERALRDAEEALQSDPRCISAYMTIIRICWDMGWHERALRMGKAVNNAHPGSLEATLAYARALNNAGMAEMALPLTMSVLAVDATNPTALKLVIWNHLMAGDPKAALQAARSYMPGHPLDSNTRWATCLAHYCVGETDRALLAAEDALRADPTDITIWTLLGYVYRLSDSEDEAQQTWLKGIRRVTQRGSLDSNWRTQVWLANLLAATGDTHGARGLIGGLLESQRGNAYIEYRASHVLAEMEDSDGAIRMLEEAVDHGFLSIQILRHEERFALSRLVRDPAYWTVTARLSTAVSVARGIVFDD